MPAPLALAFPFHFRLPPVLVVAFRRHATVRRRKARTTDRRVDSAHVAEYASGNPKYGQTTPDRGAWPA